MRRWLPVTQGLVLALLFGLIPGVLGTGRPVAAAVPTTAQDGATPVAADCPATTEAENEALARRWYDDVLNGRDLDVLDELLAPNAAHAAGTFPDAADPAATKQILGELLTGFSDARHTVEAAVAEGDLVALRWSASGTHDGEFQGIAPTGRRATWDGINLFRVECGTIAEVWSEVDGLGRLQQLGAATGTPEAGAVGATPLASAATPAATPTECAATGPTENEVLVRRWWGEAWSRGNLDVLPDLLAEDQIHHWAVGPDTTGVDAVASRIGEWRQTFPNLRFQVQEVVAADDLVAGRWVATGTLQGEGLGVAPAGQAVEWAGINLFRVECGQITEVWSEMDTLGLYDQLGIEP